MLGSTVIAMLLLGASLLLPGCSKESPTSIGAGGRASIDGASAGGWHRAAPRAPATTTPEASDDRPRPGPYACRGVNSACNLLSEFPDRSGAWWGDGDDLHGGLTLLGSGLARAPDPSSLHVTGRVAGDGVGFAVWFEHCTDLSTFLGLRFRLSGALKGAPSPRVQVAVQTNSDLSWQTSPPTGKGACTPVKPESAELDCVAPSVSVALTKAPTLIHWADLAGGKPKAWDAKASPREVTGIAFTFPWNAQAKPYAVDVTFDDFGFISVATLPCTVLPLSTESP